MQMSVSGALEAAFVNLERGSGAINDDLQKLKADMRQQGKLITDRANQAVDLRNLEFGKDLPRF